MGKGEWAGANSLMTPQAQVEAYNTYVEKYLLLLLLEMCQKLSITTRRPEEGGPGWGTGCFPLVGFLFVVWGHAVRHWGVEVERERAATSVLACKKRKKEAWVSHAEKPAVEEK